MGTTVSAFLSMIRLTDLFSRHHNYFGSPNPEDAQRRMHTVCSESPACLVVEELFQLLQIGMFWKAAAHVHLRARTIHGSREKTSFEDDAKSVSNFLFGIGFGELWL